jgi:hypothetical protein
VSRPISMYRQDMSVPIGCSRFKTMVSALISGMWTGSSEYSSAYTGKNILALVLVFPSARRSLSTMADGFGLFHRPESAQRSTSLYRKSRNPEIAPGNRAAKSSTAAMFAETHKSGKYSLEVELVLWQKGIRDRQLKLGFQKLENPRRDSPF